MLSRDSHVQLFPAGCGNISAHLLALAVRCFHLQHFNAPHVRCQISNAVNMLLPIDSSFRIFNYCSALTCPGTESSRERDTKRGCYDSVYHSVSSSRPTDTEVLNKRLLSDVVNFVRLTTKAIKVHVSETARLDNILQDIAENYFPEAFSNEAVLLQARRSVEGERALDLGGTGTGGVTSKGGRTYPSHARSQVHRLRPIATETVRHASSETSIGPVPSMGRGSNLLHIADSTAPQGTLILSRTSPRNPSRPLSASGSLETHVPHHINSSSCSSSRSEALMTLPDSLTGLMPPRTSTAQLSKKTLLHAKKTFASKSGKDFDSRLGSAQHHCHSQCS